MRAGTASMMNSSRVLLCILMAPPLGAATGGNLTVGRARCRPVSLIREFPQSLWARSIGRSFAPTAARCYLRTRPSLSGREADSMLIIVGREHEGLYEGLKRPQEANGKDRVILDRRRGDRRQVRGIDPGLERRRGERRRPLTDAERALMNVLGFAVLQRER